MPLLLRTGRYARDQFHNRTRDFSPLDIIGHYVEPGRDFAPGTNQDYCSANYILLGLALAYHYDRPASWAGYDQRTVIPAGLRQAFNHSAFVNTGTCADHTPVHGFMQSYSTAALPPQDVWNISCAGGWTAGNYVGSVGDVARCAPARASQRCRARGVGAWARAQCCLAVRCVQV